jgi:serine/threonine protein phosphatase PrpC
MDKLRIVDSGVAQLTKREKAAYLHSNAPIHSNDQDRLVHNTKHGIFAVADGVGGEYRGDLAAQAACDAFYAERRAPGRTTIPDEESLRVAQTSLLQIIHAAAQQTGGYSTFTGYYRTKANRIAYLHAGDSSLVVYRQGEVHRITSPHHFMHHANQLTNYVGGEYEVGPGRMAPEPGTQYNSLTEWGFVKLQDGDVCILATDGVTSLTGDRELLDAQAKACIEKRSRVLGAKAIASRLLLASDRPDDVTVSVVKFGKKKKS